MKRSEVLKGSIETAVLALLSTGDLHGYDIMKRLKEEGKTGLLAVKEGTLYPLLHRLEAEGLVRGRWEKGNGKRRLRVYSITALGKRDFTERTTLFAALMGAIKNLRRGGKLAGGRS